MSGLSFGITGAQLIAGTDVRDGPAVLAVRDRFTSAELEPRFREARAEDVYGATAAAAAAFTEFRLTSPELRAGLLETIALGMEAAREGLVDRAVRETGLASARLDGEISRTSAQLRLFAGVLRQGSWQHVRIAPADPDRFPTAAPEIRQGSIAIGPVAVFGASNFPFAFSVAGGDTAAALAAGCPVVVRAHPAHPGTSELVGRIIIAAIQASGVPSGAFSLLQGESHEVGRLLATAPEIQAVAFTGSSRGGLALAAAVAGRPTPIPVFAEMSSINPVVVLPEALRCRGPQIARELVAVISGSMGQLCTKPGLVVVPEGSGRREFLAALRESLAEVESAPMLTPAIHEAFLDGVRERSALPGVETLAGGSVDGMDRPRSIVFVVAAKTLARQPVLTEEIFGPATVVATVGSMGEPWLSALAPLRGQLAASIHYDDGDEEMARQLLPWAEEHVGRIVVNGWPTGVEVGEATVHGGPFPATTDARFTSVGARAIERFLRPVAYQNFPQALLPGFLRGA